MIDPPARAELRRYLLGQIAEDRAAAIDQVVFSDEEAYRAAAAARTSLLRDYVEGKLDYHARRSLRSQLRLSSSLRTELKQLTSDTPRFGLRRRLSLAMPAAASFLVVLLVYLAIRPPIKPRHELSAKRPATISNNSRLPRPADVALFVSAIVPRGPASIPVLTVPRDAARVTLQLEIRDYPSESAKWSVEVYRRGAGEVAEAANLSEETVGAVHYLAFPMETAKLPAGVYTIRMSDDRHRLSSERVVRVNH